MIRNKNLNYALIVFAITLSLLFAFAELYPVESIAEADINSTEQTVEAKSLKAFN